MRTVTTLVSLTMALALVGCQHQLSEKDIVGSWSGKVALSESDVKAAKAKGLTDAQIQQSRQAMSASTVTLDLKEDKTFELGLGVPMTGKWSFAEKKVELKVEKIAGMDMKELAKAMPKDSPVNDTISLTAQDDGKSMLGTGSGGGQFSFTKNEKK